MFRLSDSVFPASEEAHIEAGHYDSVTYLRLWSGDLQGALQLATERGELNDHLLSIAPMGAHEAVLHTSAVFCYSDHAAVNNKTRLFYWFFFQPVSRRGGGRWRPSSSSCVCRSST